MTEYLQGRQAIYEYLYMAYYRIPDVRFVKLTKQFFPIFASIGKETNGDIAVGAEMLSDFLKANADIPDEKLAEQMNIEFTGLFLKADHIQTTESNWRREEKSKTELITSISNYFAEANLAKPTEINIPIDSYSMELFYLYQTSRAAAQNETVKQDKIIEQQFAFAKNHILCWTDRFTCAIIDNTYKNSFYKCMAYLSTGFLRYDFSVSEEVDDVQENNQVFK